MIIKFNVITILFISSFFLINFFLGREFYIQLADKNDLYYSSPFIFGSNSQSINLVYDTQTDWTIVFSTDCRAPSCNPNMTTKYERRASTTSSKGLDSTTNIPFVTGYLTGRTTNDQVCVVTGTDSKLCATNVFTFFEVTSTDLSLSAYTTGILGIAPDDPSNGPSFIALLYENRIIAQKMLGMLISKQPKASYVTFGGYTEFLMYSINGADPIISWYPSQDTKRWKV